MVVFLCVFVPALFPYILLVHPYMNSIFANKTSPPPPPPSVTWLSIILRSAKTSSFFNVTLFLGLLRHVFNHSTIGEFCRTEYVTVYLLVGFLRVMWIGSSWAQQIILPLCCSGDVIPFHCHSLRPFNLPLCRQVCQ